MNSFFQDLNLQTKFLLNYENRHRKNNTWNCILVYYMKNNKNYQTSQMVINLHFISNFKYILKYINF